MIKDPTCFERDSFIRDTGCIDKGTSDGIDDGSSSKGGIIKTGGCTKAGW